MLVKLTPIVKFTNTLRLWYQYSFTKKITKPKLLKEKIRTKHLCTKKAARKMLMKLTP